MLVVHASWLPRAVVVIGVVGFALCGTGSLCLDDNAEERQRCEDVCAAIGQCADEGLPTEEECLDELCDDEGFIVVKDDEGDVDLADAASNDCILDANTCADIVVCTCDDACARVDDCTGDDNAEACVGDCNVLVEQAPEQTYAENRCKMESTCEDLPLCTDTEN